MDWIAGLQRAIDFVEEHLTEEIDYEAVAKEACSSSFHFQRVFGVICGFTLGDYIRMRRLSLAAADLAGTKDKVIDIALKYGYDTPESFTRAFTRFHGISPTQARRGGNVKSFSRLSVKLILTGGSTMDYRIEKLDGYIPKEPRLKGLLGICYSDSTEGLKFPYGIGAEYDGRPVEEGLEIVEIPAHTYAAFQCRGKMPEAFTETYRKIVTEFFPQNGRYEYVQEVELEVYPSDKVEDPNYTCEIWVAVKEKQ